MKTLWTTLLLLLIAGCSNPPEPLRVGLLEWPPYEIVRLAEALGHLDPDRVEIVDFQGPAEARRTYAAGGIDVIALTVDYALVLSSRDPDHQAFLVVDESTGGDSVIAREPVSTLAELEGRRIGYEASELGAHMLHRLLEHAGLSMDDVTPVHMDIPDQLDAWQAGSVDVLITYEPLRTRLLADGGHEIFTSRDLPGEIIDVFIARRSQMDRRQDDFRHFAEAWFKALEYVHENPRDAADRLAPALGITPAQFLDTLDGVHLVTLQENHEWLGNGQRDFLRSISRFADSMRAAGNVALPEKLQPFFTTTALPPAGGE